MQKERSKRLSAECAAAIRFIDDSDEMQGYGEIDPSALNMLKEDFEPAYGDVLAQLDDVLLKKASTIDAIAELDTQLDQQTPVVAVKLKVLDAMVSFLRQHEALKNARVERHAELRELVADEASLNKVLDLMIVDYAQFIRKAKQSAERLAENNSNSGSAVCC